MRIEDSESVSITQPKDSDWLGMKSKVDHTKTRLNWHTLTWFLAGISSLAGYCVIMNSVVYLQKMFPSYNVTDSITIPLESFASIAAICSPFISHHFTLRAIILTTFIGQTIAITLIFILASAYSDNLVAFCLLYGLLCLNGFFYESYGTRTLAYTSFFHEDYLRFYVTGIGASSLLFCVLYMVSLALLGTVGSFWVVFCFLMVALVFFASLVLMVLRVAKTDRVEMTIHSTNPRFFDTEKWQAIFKETWLELLVTMFVAASVLAVFPSKMTEVELSGFSSDWSYQILYFCFALFDTSSRVLGGFQVKSDKFNILLIFLLRLSAGTFTLLRCYTQGTWLQTDAFGVFQACFQGLTMGYSYNLIVSIHQRKMHKNLGHLKEFSGLVLSFMANSGFTLGSVIQYII